MGNLSLRALYIFSKVFSFFTMREPSRQNLILFFILAIQALYPYVPGVETSGLRHLGGREIRGT